MHNLLEAVCIYVMQSIIDKLIFEKEYFDLQFLHSKINSFDFGPTEKGD